jgi:YD repeat-containing protein
MIQSVSVTPPAGSARTTTYDYDDADQLTAVTHADGTRVCIGFDAAHRPTEITDAMGNKVSFVLDGSGNRIAEELRDPAGVSRGSSARSYGALNRLQQVTGAAQ